MRYEQDIEINESRSDSIKNNNKLNIKLKTLVETYLEQNAIPKEDVSIYIYLLLMEIFPIH